MTKLRAAFLVGVLAALAGCGDEHAPAKGITIGKTTSHLYVLPSVLWKTPGNIPVCFEVSGFETEKQWAKDAFAGWEKANAAIKFTGYGACAAGAPGIHVTHGSGADGPHVKEFGEALSGTAAGMVLDFTFANDEYYAACRASQAMRERCFKSVAIHEMGHALGFLHEHERTDTPQSCEYREPVADGTEKVIGPWDVMSIMNYCYPDRDNVFPTDLSPTDIAGLLEMYPPPPKATPAPTKPAETGDGKTTPQSEEIGDDDDDEPSRKADDDDDDDAPKKKPKKKTAATPPAGCQAGAGPVDPSSAAWILAIFASVARRRKKAA